MNNSKMKNSLLGKPKHVLDEKLKRGKLNLDDLGLGRSRRSDQVSMSLNFKTPSYIPPSNLAPSTYLEPRSVQSRN